MIESRCGILCAECSYKEQVDCKGCVYINKPFWGKICSVKSCCETKGLNHCGECNEFVCDLLNEFSYDEEQGDNGKRIIQCKQWKLMQESDK